MRITIVMGFFLPMPPVAGGATEKTWQRLAHEFARRGHEVTIVSRTWSGWPVDEVRDGIRHLRFPGHDHAANLPRNLWHDLRWSLRLRDQLPRADVTIINSVTLAAVLGARRELGRRIVMVGRMPKGQFRWYRRLDRVLAVSTPVLAAVRRENPAAAAQALVTGYPIDWQQLSAGGRERPAGAPLSIGYVGRIHREKGPQLLVRALVELAKDRSLPAWRAVICGPCDIPRGGSGPAFLAELRAELAAAPLPVACEFRDPVFDPAELAGLYQSFDLFCYPSVAERGETFGVAVAEAMAAGAVPIVSALPCFNDYVRPDENGLVFDHRGAEPHTRLARVIAATLRDPAGRRKLAAAARQTVARYDFGEYADRLLTDFSALK